MECVCAGDLFVTDSGCGCDSNHHLVPKEGRCVCDSEHDFVDNDGQCECDSQKHLVYSRTLDQCVCNASAGFQEKNGECVCLENGETYEPLFLFSTKWPYCAKTCASLGATEKYRGSKICVCEELTSETAPYYFWAQFDWERDIYLPVKCASRRACAYGGHFLSYHDQIP